MLSSRFLWVRTVLKSSPPILTQNAGPMGCVGRPLAIMELKILLTKLLMTFDVSLAPGETGKDLIEKSRDHFTIETGPLNLVFKERVIK